MGLDKLEIDSWTRMRIADVQVELGNAIKKWLHIPGIKECVEEEHIKDTPRRVTSSLFSMFEGCWVDPKSVLQTTFTNGKYDEIVYVNSISFVSLCTHHLLSFFGKAHFGYLPGSKIVGLSKIPRLIEVYSKRPQIQEQLTVQIIDTFNELVEPKGCGLVMEATHLCMCIRGVENESSYTKTTALRGCFRDGTVKEEFLDGIKQSTKQIWP